METRGPHHLRRRRASRLAATITSLREVSWDSFRPNFFVLVSPGALDDYPASWITAVSVPKTQPRFTAELVERFPNLTVIDVEAMLAQVRDTADQVSMVVQVVFWFSLAAGILVLLAAISASQDERLLEGGVMRVLGGSRRQLRLAQASEFAAIGLLSGLVAAIAASVLAGVISDAGLRPAVGGELGAGRGRRRHRDDRGAGHGPVRDAARGRCRRPRSCCGNCSSSFRLRRTPLSPEFRMPSHVSSLVLALSVALASVPALPRTRNPGAVGGTSTIAEADCGRSSASHAVQQSPLSP